MGHQDSIKEGTSHKVLGGGIRETSTRSKGINNHTNRHTSIPARASIKERPPNNKLKEEEIFKISEMRETNIYVQITTSTTYK